MIRLNLWDLSLKTPPSSSARFSPNFFRHILPFLTMSRGCTWISRFFSPPILGIFSERFFLHRERGCKRLSINRREAPFSIYGSFFLFFFFPFFSLRNSGHSPSKDTWWSFNTSCCGKNTGFLVNFIPLLWNAFTFLNLLASSFSSLLSEFSRLTLRKETSNLCSIHSLQEMKNFIMNVDNVA